MYYGFTLQYATPKKCLIYGFTKANKRFGFTYTRARGWLMHKLMALKEVYFFPSLKIYQPRCNQIVEWLL